MRYGAYGAAGLGACWLLAASAPAAVDEKPVIYVISVGQAPRDREGENQVRQQFARYAMLASAAMTEGFAFFPDGPLRWNDAFRSQVLADLRRLAPLWRARGVQPHIGFWQGMQGLAEDRNTLLAVYQMFKQACPEARLTMHLNFHATPTIADKIVSAWPHDQFPKEMFPVRTYGPMFLKGFTLDDALDFCDRNGIECEADLGGATGLGVDQKTRQPLAWSQDQRGENLSFNLASPMIQKLYSTYVDLLGKLYGHHRSLGAVGIHEWVDIASGKKDNSIGGFSPDERAFYERSFGKPFRLAWNPSGGPDNAELFQLNQRLRVEFWRLVRDAAARRKLAFAPSSISYFQRKGDMTPSAYAACTDRILQEAYISRELGRWQSVANPVALMAPLKNSLLQHSSVVVLSCQGRNLSDHFLVEDHLAEFTQYTWIYAGLRCGPTASQGIDNLAAVLERFSGVMVVPFRATTLDEDNALLDWVRRGNVLLLPTCLSTDECGAMPYEPGATRPVLPPKYRSDPIVRLLAGDFPKLSFAEAAKPAVRINRRLGPLAPETEQDISDCVRGRSVLVADSLDPKAQVLVADGSGRPFLTALPVGDGHVLAFMAPYITDSLRPDKCTIIASAPPTADIVVADKPVPDMALIRAVLEHALGLARRTVWVESREKVFTYAYPGGLGLYNHSLTPARFTVRANPSRPPCHGSIPARDFVLAPSFAPDPDKTTGAARQQHSARSPSARRETKRRQTGKSSRRAKDGKPY